MEIQYTRHPNRPLKIVLYSKFEKPLLAKKYPSHELRFMIPYHKFMQIIQYHPGSTTGNLLFWFHASCSYNMYLLMKIIEPLRKRGLNLKKGDFLKIDYIRFRTESSYELNDILIWDGKKLIESNCFNLPSVFRFPEFSMSYFTEHPRFWLSSEIEHEIAQNISYDIFPILFKEPYNKKIVYSWFDYNTPVYKSLLAYNNNIPNDIINIITKYSAIRYWLILIIDECSSKFKDETVVKKLLRKICNSSRSYSINHDFLDKYGETSVIRKRCQLLECSDDINFIYTPDYIVVYL